MLHQKGRDFQVLVARVGLQERLELVVDRAPGRNFLGGVLDPRDGLPEAVLHGVFGQESPPLPVRRVVEARVVRLQVSARVQDPVGHRVQVGDVPREPGHLQIVEHQQAPRLWRLNSTPKEV